MDRSELDIIKELMAELESKMQPGKDDFEERLGRKKPGIEVLKIEGKVPGQMAMEDGDDMMGSDMEGDMPADGEMMDKTMQSDGMDMGDSMMDEEMSPESKLKARLMKLRA